jgi:very-short-patch-repair endonuclease
VPFRRSTRQRGAWSVADDGGVTVESREEHRGGAHVDSRRLEAALSALAGRQRGVVGRRQLQELGFSRRQIGVRLEQRRLVPLHRGVYAVGHPALAVGAWEQAALLAAGPGAALAHRSAAAWWRMLGRCSGAVEVVVPRQAGRRIPRVVVHRCASLRPEDVTEEAGLRCTTPARTLIDLAASAPALLPRALTEAERLHLDVAGVLPRLASEPGRRGARALAAALAAFDPRAARTRSALELRFLELVRAAGLPAPQVNVVVGAGRLRPEVDALWAAERVVAELDGRAFHDVVAAGEADRARDNALALAGHLVLRFTWRRLEDDPRGVVAEVAAALSSRGRRPARDRLPGRRR